MAQKKSKSYFGHLHKKWSARQKQIENRLLARHGDTFKWLHDSSQQFLASSIAGLIMMTHPASSSIIAEHLQSPDQTRDKEKKEESTPHTKMNLIGDLKNLLPSEVAPLTPESEVKIASTLSEYFKIPVAAVYQGKRLNRSYGLIGAEQHLTRYPGDNMSTHFQTESESIYAGSGMAPGRGAWGYFTDSAGSINQEDIEREKYYIAVPTFLAPGWEQGVNELYRFFKYRKMLVVNPENGKAMVVVIGDAGPAPWTGKHLGGSPEVMSYLERVDGGARGPVLYYFIDDPGGEIPLGPIQIR